MSELKTPDKLNSYLKPGSIAINSKWQNTDVHRSLKELFNAVKTMDMRSYDFALPNMNIIYLGEDKLVSGVDVTKIFGLEKICIIADRNTLTIQIFCQIQESLISNGLSLLPVGNRREVPLLLYQLHLSDTAQSPGSKYRPTMKLQPDAQLQLLLCVPGLGPIKAKKLLATLGTVSKVAFSKVEDLVSIVGLSSANQVYNFFNKIDR